MLTKLKKIDFQKNFKITQKISQVQFNISINIKEHAVSSPKLQYIDFLTISMKKVNFVKNRQFWKIGKNWRIRKKKLQGKFRNKIS